MLGQALLLPAAVRPRACASRWHKRTSKAAGDELTPVPHAAWGLAHGERSLGPAIAYSILPAGG